MYFMVIKFINLKELLESLVLVITLKRLLNVIKEWDTIWISRDMLYGKSGSVCSGKTCSGLCNRIDESFDMTEIPNLDILT